MNEKSVTKSPLLNIEIYQKMINEIDDYAIILLDANGIINNWNKGAEKIKGFKAEEIIGQSFSLFYSEEDKKNQIPEKALAEAREKGKKNSQGWRLKKDGSFIWVNSVLKALYTEDGKQLIGFTKIIHDLTEQKRMKEHLEFFANIVRNIHDPIISTDTNFIITDWNEAAEKLVGWKKSEVIGKTTDAILNVIYPNNDKEEAHTSFIEKGFWQGEVTYHTKSNEPLNMLITASNIKNPDGLIAGTLILARDITKRKTMEKTLAKLNDDLEKKVKERTEEIFKHGRRFQSLIENDYTITSLINENYETIYRSPSAETILGWTEDERNSMPIESIMHPDELELQRNSMKEVMTNPGKPIQLVFRTKHKKGHYVWVESIAVNRLSDPDVHAIVINMHDITERKKAEDAIKENESNYQLLIARISDGFIALDADFKYTYANQRIGEMTGMDPQWLIGKCVWDVFPDAINSPTFKAFRQAFEEQRYISNVDHYPQLNLWQENHIYPSPNGLSIFIKDISERRKADILIEEMNENLEDRVKSRTMELTAANKALESFSYMVSHDLHAPVRTLTNFTNIILQKHSASFDQELKDLFEFILTSSKRMNLIIDDLLRLAKYGNEHLETTTINLTQLFQTIWNNLISSTPGNAKLDLPDLPFIKADASMLEQVIVNLLSNAIKYSSKKEQPLIKIDYFNLNGEQTFFVNDNGVGFNMDQYSKLFGAFQRLHDTKDFEGTGIGLLLVKKIIENHGGRIWAEGKVNEGATFYFTIPQ